MASRIEHASKRDAYQRVYLWAKREAEDTRGSGAWFAREKAEGHDGYMEEMEKSGRYWVCTPPRSRFINWLAHKLLEWTWGHNLYL